MTDQWVPGPACTPVPPDGIPPANTWTPADSCAPPSGPSITGGVIITGVPATIVAPYAWGITLNDGSAPPNFSIDHFDSTGALIESPIAIDGASGDVTVTHDPTQPLGVATKEYVDLHSAGVTEAPTDGQQYARQNEGWTAILPDPVQEAPNDGQAYVRQSLGWAPLSASLTGYMPISGGAFTGPVTFPANNSVLIAGAAGTPRAILGVTGNAARWQMLLGDPTAESGSNAGSNFALTAISDTGSILSTPLAIARASGAITVGVIPGIVPLTLNGAAGSWRSLAGASNGSQRWQMYLGDFNAELGGNLGSNFRLSSYTDAGGALASPLVIARQTGVATFSALPSFPGGASGNVLSTNGAGALSWIAPSGGGIADAPNDGTAYARKSAAWANLAHTDITDWTATLAPYALTTSVPVGSTTTPLMNGTAAVGTASTWARADHVHPTDTSLYPTSNPAGYQTAAQVTASLANYLPLAGGTVTGQLNLNTRLQSVGYTCRGGVSGAFSANAFNMFYVAPNVSVWIDNTTMGSITFQSDYRIKQNVEPLGGMWETVKALKPVSFEHKDFTPDWAGAPLSIADGVERWGFIAHELQETLIESAATGVKDERNLIQSPNPWTIIAALTKALQEAMTRIEALEAR